MFRSPTFKVTNALWRAYFASQMLIGRLNEVPDQNRKQLLYQKQKSDIFWRTFKAAQVKVNKNPENER